MVRSLYSNYPSQWDKTISETNLEACPKSCESVEKLGSEQILFAVTIPCRATEYCREEHRR